MQSNELLIEAVQLLREIRDLLSGEVLPVGNRKTTNGKIRTSASSTEGAELPSDAPVEILLAAHSDAEEWNAVWDSKKAIDRWLAVLAIAETEVGEGTALGAGDIVTVLEKRFRVGGVYATNANRDLKNARAYVTRRPKGKGFEYRLTRQGLDYISKRRDELAR